MNKIIDQDYYDFIIINTIEEIEKYKEDITMLNERHSILHVKKDVEMCDLGDIPYHRFPSIYITNSTSSLEKSGVMQVRRNPFLSLFGQGVLVGIVDTGIDYQHQVFRNSDNTTRIMSIWDQTIETDNPPVGFVYGTEYREKDINLALSSKEPLAVVPSVDTSGHGTAIASIAAGSIKDENSFSGVAPKSNLVIVKLKKAKKKLYEIFGIPEDKECYQETDVLMGVRYLLEKSLQLQMPIVVCVALGSSQGSHLGLGALSSYLNVKVLFGKYAVAIAAGNEGGTRRHFFEDVSNRSFRSEIELKIGRNDKSFSMEIWTKAPNRCSVEVFAPTGETTKSVFPSLLNCKKFSFIFNPSNVWINNFILEEENGEQLILIRFQNATEGIWKIKLQNLEERDFTIHSWLPAGDLISNETYFLNSSSFNTITSPGNSVFPLTVTAYNSTDDSLILESSRGYTLLDIVKPDVAAPGYEITCAIQDQRFGSLTGTGAAAAHAAGILAMLYEWAVVRENYTSITGVGLNRLVNRGAVRKSNLTYPNREWGYGQINIDSIFKNLSID